MRGPQKSGEAKGLLYFYYARRKTFRLKFDEAFVRDRDGTVNNDESDDVFFWSIVGNYASPEVTTKDGRWQ